MKVAKNDGFLQMGGEIYKSRKYSYPNFETVRVFEYGFKNLILLDEILCISIRLAAANFGVNGTYISRPLTAGRRYNLQGHIN